MIRKILYILSLVLDGILFGVGLVCVYFCLECVRAWVSGYLIFLSAIPVIALTAVAYLIAAWTVWNMTVYRK